MKLEDFKIQFFENQRGVFCVGDEVKGKVCINLRQPMKMRTIKIYFEGKGKSHWEVKHGRSKTDYRANETYINSTLVLYGGAEPSSSATEHPAGYHEYEFGIRLGPTLPSSFEGKRGYVRYFCKATIDRPWKFDENTKRAFTVIRHLDLNSLPDSAFPVFGEENKNIEGCCCSRGSVSVQLMLNKKGFVPGEPMVYTIDINNASDYSCDGVRLELRQTVNIMTYCLQTFCRELCLVFFASIRSHKTDQISQSVLIPALPPSKLDGCGIIDVKYAVLLTVPVNWSSVQIEREIVIGTIPLHQANPLPSYPAIGVPSLDNPASAPPMEPPPYIEPPPAYEDCVFGGANIRDEHDDEHTSGQTQWTPAYPYYTWDNRRPPPAIPSAPPPAYDA
ncbi:hypothetical protein LOTGIDRAFT_222971 [Lottia gigantea]|uniref:Arrestin C-terminal-like domain-containing protein n=1 Tax=Lottia gigantea TaxID=225164 RepID=V3ZKW2_LOTGI|nr:hypothetical protein LOTGIDRAFT_222971 [Lottia gigantea]ESO83040.1 hypothetical protein LOTGIDRAFT_222971 [Lottia gigantea]